MTFTLAAIALLIARPPAQSAAPALLPPPAAAQSEEQTAPVLRLAAPQAPPGGETFVTMMHESLPSQPVQVVRSEIDFPSDQLTYVSSRLGLAAELAAASLEIALRTPQDTPVQAPPGGSAPPPIAAGMSRLAIAVTAKRAIPNGPVVELRFRVNEKARQGRTKIVQHTEAFSPEGAKVANLVASAGEVHITTEKKGPNPIFFGCFFYMH